MGQPVPLGLWEERLSVSAPGVWAGKQVLSRTLWALAAPSLPFLSFSGKKVRSRMGPAVGYFPNVSAICGTLQLNVIISVLGSECQRTGRDGVTNSRLGAGGEGGSGVGGLAPPLLGNHPGW